MHIPRLLCAATLLGACASAQAFPFEDLFDDSAKPWTEVVAELPAPPLTENLAPIFVRANMAYTFAVDRKSISIGADGVVRYTLVSTSGQGNRNIAYEGIRCATHEKKSYAFINNDSGWSRARSPQWTDIPPGAGDGLHSVLWHDYLCNDRQVPTKVSYIDAQLRNAVSSVIPGEPGGGSH